MQIYNILSPQENYYFSTMLKTKQNKTFGLKHTQIYKSKQQAFSTTIQTTNYNISIHIVCLLTTLLCPLQKINTLNTIRLS